MKIAIVANCTSGWGGQETHIRDLSKQLFEHGHEVKLVIGPKIFIDKLEADGFEVVRGYKPKIGGRRWRRIKNFYILGPVRLWKFWRAMNDVDLVHIHTSDDYYYATVAAKLRRAATVITSHGNTVIKAPYCYQKRNWLYAKMHKWAFNMVDHTMFVSEFAKNEVMNFYNPRGDNMSVVYLAPDMPLANQPLPFYKMFPGSDEFPKIKYPPVRLKSCSQVNRFKRTDLILEGISELKKIASYDFELEIWGAGKPVIMGEFVKMAVDMRLSNLCSKCRGTGVIENWQLVNKENYYSWQ